MDHRTQIKNQVLVALINRHRINELISFYNIRQAPEYRLNNTEKSKLSKEIYQELAVFLTAPGDGE